MKCLVVSDLHYNLKQYDWLLKEAGSFDIVFIVGDLLDVASSVRPQAQIIVIVKYLSLLKEKTRLAVCSGNHDLDARNSAGEKYARWMFKVKELGIPADGNNFSINGTAFSVLPWWDGPVVLKEIEDQIENESNIEKDKWIWVYHTPPDSSPTSWDGKNHFGDKNLDNWIEKYSPFFVVSGHCHSSPFKSGGSWVDKIGSTWVFNPGKQTGDFPTHIIIDTDLKKAAWFSLYGGQEVDMKVNLERPVEDLTQMPEWI